MCEAPDEISAPFESAYAISVCRDRIDSPSPLRLNGHRGLLVRSEARYGGRVELDSQTSYDRTIEGTDY